MVDGINISGHDAIVLNLQGYSGRFMRASVRALNRSIGSGRTVMVREMARDTGLKSKDVRDALVMREASPSRLEVSLVARLRRIPLIDFKARMTSRGVVAKLPGGAGRYPNLFIATMASGHTGVFGRTGQFGRNDNPKLERISERFGPSLGQVFAKFRPLGLARVLEVFEQNFDHELEFVQGGAGAGTD